MTDSTFNLNYGERRDISILSFEECATSFIEGITTYKKRLSSNQHSYRILNHWTKLGIIDEQRSKEKGWRKFSLIEVIWLEIVKELRAYGFPNEKVLKVKEAIQKHLYKPVDTISKSLLFQYYIGVAYIKKESAFLLVFQDGNASFATYADLASSEMLKPTPNHIRIGLNNILQRLYPEKDLKPRNDKMVKLSDSEIDLLYEIRMKNPDSITVKTKEGRIKMIEVDEKLEEKSIAEILKSEPYQDLKILVRGGKVVAKKRVKKRKANT